MSKSLEAFGASIDLDASKVLNSPSLIFLCGGLIQTPNGAQPSLRSLFYQRLEKDHPELHKLVLLAEKSNEWSKAAKHYDHLFTLENDLAYLSAVILLFVESPGSIAELGAFCNVDPLREKLLVVLEHGHQSDVSFIQDGPVAWLSKQNPSSVLFYPWLGKSNKKGERHLDHAEALQTVSSVIERLEEDISSIAKEEKFDRGNQGHHILLVADMVKLGGTIKIGEIQRVLASSGARTRVAPD